MVIIILTLHTMCTFVPFYCNDKYKIKFYILSLYLLFWLSLQLGLVLAEASVMVRNLGLWLG